MNRMTRNTLMVSVLATLALSAGAWAQDHGMMDHGSMDHGTMNHGSMNHGMMDRGMMKMMDSNGDGMVSAQEHASGATAMFKMMDANSDGKVTVAEMDAAHDKMMKGDKMKSGHGMQDAKAGSDKAMHHAMSSADKIAKFDTNGDGALSASEHDAAAKAMFDKMDADKDGNMSKAEMEAGHAAMMHGDKNEGHAMGNHDHAMNKPAMHKDGAAAKDDAKQDGDTHGVEDASDHNH